MTPSLPIISLFDEHKSSNMRSSIGFHTGERPWYILGGVGVEVGDVWGQCLYPVCHGKCQNDIFGLTHNPTPENVRCDQIFFCCKTS